MDIICTSDGSRLTPVSAFYAEELDALPRGVPLKCKVTRPRSLPMHGLYWQCVSSIVKSGGANCKEDIHASTLIKTGNVAVCSTPNGDFIAYPQSTSFANMDQIAFKAYFDAAIDFWRSSKFWDYISEDLRERLEGGER